MVQFEVGGFGKWLSLGVIHTNDILVEIIYSSFWVIFFGESY